MNVKSLASACCPPFLRPAFEHIENSPLAYRLVKGAFWSLVGVGISRGLMFVALVLVARILGPKVFGELEIIRSTLGTFGVFAGFGLGTMANKYIAEFRERDPQQAGRIMGLCAFIVLASSSLVAGTLFWCAPWLAEHTLDAAHLGVLLRVGTIILFLDAVTGAQIGALAGFEAFKRIAQANLLMGLTAFPLLFCGAHWGGLTGVVWALVGVRIVNWILTLLALCLEASRSGVPLVASGFYREWKVLWHFGLPSALISMISIPCHWIVRAMLVNEPNGYAALGLLGGALAIQQVVLFLGMTLSRPLLSMISNVGVRNSERLDRVNVLSSWVLGVVCAFPLLCFPELAGILFGKDYAGPVFLQTCSIIVLTTCITISCHGFTRALLAKNMVWWAFGGFLIFGVTLVGSGFFLVQHGAMGVATTMLFADVCQASCLFFVCVRNNLVPRAVVMSWEAGLIWAALFAAGVAGYACPDWTHQALVFLAGLATVGFATHRMLKIDERAYSCEQAS